MAPRISVVMPVWNGEKYLAEAIDGILHQTFRDFEFIIVDDGSTDATPEILKSCSDPRLRLHRLDHAGIVKALNHGVSQARAEWIARQDADDISLPGRLEAQWKALNSNPNAILAHTHVEWIGEDGHNLGSKGARFPRTRAFLALKLCFQCPIVHSTVMFNKQVFDKVDGYRPEERHAEDYSLWGRMLERGEFIGLPERLIKFRIHPLSVSKQNLETQIALTRKIAIAHCKRFMNLSDAEAQRAHAVLATPPRERQWADWWWFLTCCAPRLRWKSAETCGWLLWQTLKQALRWQTYSQACSMTGR